MKKVLCLLAVFMLLLLASAVLAEEEVFALPAEEAIEEMAFALGEEPVPLTAQADDKTGDTEPVLSAAEDGEGSDPAADLIDRVVTISLKEGVEITKVYDKTRNVKISSSSFVISGVADGDNLRLSKITAAYDSPRAGTRTVTLSFEISQNSSTYNYILEPATITVPATITPKTLTITPTADQGKVYGAEDPTMYKSRVSGLMSGDSVSGALSRDPGEDVGRYRITLGTITAKSSYDEEGESSYVIDLKEDFFTISPKSINATEIGMVAIGNQKYTGSAIEPPISLRYGEMILTQGTDYVVEYTDNIMPGIATATITGIGNYTDTRTAAFRIIKVGDGERLVLPGDLKQIDEEAFAGIGAARVIVPHGCESIGPRAFADCPWLEYIFIPGTVDTIDDTAFENSPNVAIDTDALSIVEWARAHGLWPDSYSDPDETPTPDPSQTPTPGPSQTPNPSVTPQPD